MQRCRKGKNWSLLLGVLVASYFWYIVGSVLLHLVSTGAGFAFPLLLDAITRYLELCGAEAVGGCPTESPSPSTWHGSSWAKCALYTLPHYSVSLRSPSLLLFQDRWPPVSLQDAERNKAYVFAALNFICPLLSGLAHVHSNRLATLAQVKTSAAVIAELFRKSMRMSNA